MSIHLISAILRQPWYIEPDFVQAHAPLIAQFIQRGYVPVPGELREELSKKPYTIKAPVTGSTAGAVAAAKIQGSLRSGYNYNEAPAGSKAVIPIKGVLLKEDQDDGCGYFVAGTQTIASRIREADQHPNINGIILNIDSPGGSVAGIQSLADTIKNTQKPIIAFVDGMAASAGYFAASAADYIMLENESISAGCIGTMISIIDTQPYFEAMGVKFHDIVSNLSPDKNADYYKALEGDYDPIKENTLDPLAKQFHDYVMAARPNIDKSALTGKMYFAADAQKLNLADEIGSIERAVQKLDEMAGITGPVAEAKTGNQTIDPQPKPKNFTQMKNLPLLIALLAVDALEITDDGVFLNQTQLQTIEQRLAQALQAETDLTNANEAHQTAIDAVNAQLATAQEELQEARNQVAERDTRIEELTKGPGEPPAGAAAQTDGHTDGEEDLNPVVAELPTNEAIAKLREAGFNY